MSLGDIVVKDSVITPAALTYNVSSTTASIKAGEPVSPAVAGQTGLSSSQVIPAVTSSPIISTTTTNIAYVGIAQTTSTQTTSADGTVDVIPVFPGIVYLISPKTAATWNTQAKYNALVGARVTLDLTAGVYTINATDGYNNGCVVMPLDIAKYPGKVAFQIRPGANYLAVL